jgi:ribosomal protein S18 acetylase RimI-like enzyme
VTPVVWRAEAHEAPAVARLLVEFRDWNASDWPSDNAFLAGVERLIERADTDFLLGALDSDNPPGGVCQLRYRSSVWMAAEDCWLEDIYVQAAARRHGLGRALLAAGLARARERGARRIELDTNETNAPALALYESLGFSTSSKGGAGRDLFLGRRLD